MTQDSFHSAVSTSSKVHSGQGGENAPSAGGRYSGRIQCSSCKGSGTTGEHGCTDCLGKGLDFAAFVGGIEGALNDAYAEGRKDERESLSKAAQDILAERERQQDREGYTTAHDDEHTPDDLADAAAAYALVAHFARTGIAAGDVWPWDEASFKPREARRNYVRAAALLQAAVELIDRQEARNGN